MAHFGPIVDFRHTSELSSPALCVDERLMLKNHSTALEILSSSNKLRNKNVKLRPHYKSHKCPAIAQYQLDSSIPFAEVVGITCATVTEVESVVNYTTCRNVLLANEIAEESKILRIANICKLFEKESLSMILTIDSVELMDDTNEIMKQCGVVVGVLLEINTGQNRCGVDSGNDLVTLFEHFLYCENLRFMGIQAYQGSMQHVRKTEKRKQISEDVCNIVREGILALLSSKIWVKGFEHEMIISGGGTGSFVGDLDCPSSVHTELQLGSYLFMDVDYEQNEESYNLFGQSLYIIVTVISSNATSGRFVLNAGMKSHSVDSGLPKFVERKYSEKFTISNGGDEHLICKCKPSQYTERSIPKVGDRIKLIPGHVDPTFNLHSQVHIIRHNHVLRTVDVHNGYDPIDRKIVKGTQTQFMASL